MTDEINLKGATRLPLILAIYWIASEGGAKQIDDAPRDVAPRFKGDKSRPVTYLSETVEALDRATGQLLAAIISGVVTVRGKRAGDAARAVEVISSDEFPQSFVGPISAASFEQILGDCGRYLDVSAASEITDGRTVLWGDLTVSGDAILARWPVAAAGGLRRSGRPGGVGERVAAAMQADLLSGKFDVAGAKEVELEARYGAVRDTCRKARKKVLSETR